MQAVIISVQVTVPQITESLKRYGINETVTCMLVARFEGTPEEVRHVWESKAAHVKHTEVGMAVALKQTSRRPDLTTVRADGQGARGCER